MAFTKKEWKNRVSDNPYRRKLTPVGGGDAYLVDVQRNEGTILQEGDAFSAANMNDLEDRIEAGIEDSTQSTVIAGVEETSTASKAYAVNEYLVYDSKLYRVRTAIASGGTLVPGTNLTEVTVGGEIHDHLVIPNGSTNGNTPFYFDFKNNQYGYNTSANRGADTFHPFKTDTVHSVYAWVEAYANNDTHNCHATTIIYVDGVERARVQTENFWPSGGGNWKTATTSTISV
jgi:hypothetical protein